MWEKEFTLISYEEPTLLMLRRVGLFQYKQNGLYVACDKLRQYHVLTVVQELRPSEQISAAQLYIISQNKSIAQLMFRHFMDRSGATETLLMDAQGGVLSPQKDPQLRLSADSLAKNIEAYI